MIERLGRMYLYWAIGFLLALCVAPAFANFPFGSVAATASGTASVTCASGLVSSGTSYYRTSTGARYIGHASLPAPSGYANIDTCPGSPNFYLSVKGGFAQCPANSTSTGSDCACNATYLQQGASGDYLYSCVSAATVCAAAAGSTVSLTIFQGYTAKGASPSQFLAPAVVLQDRCDGGCVQTMQSGAQAITECHTYSGTQKTYCTQKFTTTSSPCASQPSGDTESAATPCPTGYSTGTVNGISGCYVSTGTPAVPPVPTSSSTASSQSTSGGNTITTNVTTNNNGSVTTTVTTTNTSTGALVSQTQSTAAVQAGSGQNGNSEMSKFCADNPNSPMCKLGTFSGTCGAFVCDGDGIQCAISSDQHKRNCTLFDTATTLSTLGTNVAAGSDPDAATLPQHPSQLASTSVGTLSTSTFLAGGSLTDQTVSLGAHSFVIPWSSWNAVLGYLGYIVMAFAFVAAYKIVGVH